MAVIMDLEIEQGATYTAELIVADTADTPIDLTGYTARMSIKRNPAETAALLSLTTANGRILITPASGSVTLYLTAAETAALTWRSGVYDLEVEAAGGNVTRLAEGAVTVRPEVTT